MAEKIRVNWLTPEVQAVGNALGYQTFNNAMKTHCAEFFEYTTDADIVLQLVPADFFKPVKGKFNILFTMWECIDVPQSYVDNMAKADLVIVPSRWNKEIFTPLTKTPIKVCPLGVDPDVFRFVERRLPVPQQGEHYRILWLGAPNPRKGYYSVMELVKIVERIPELELYLKTTSQKKLTLRELLMVVLLRFVGAVRNLEPREFKRIWQSIRRFVLPEVADKLTYMGKHKNIVMDTRKLTRGEIVELYQSAHCFVMPHMGEGWCLPMAEAMATGCPCVASDATAVKEFFDKEVGFPVKVEINKTDLSNYKLKQARVYVPDTIDFINQVFYVLKNYRDALKRGRKASYRVRTEFTWHKAARRLAAIVGEIKTGAHV